MWRALLILIVSSAAPAWAGNLDAFWVSDGSHKIARQDFFPGGASSNTITTNWDGDTGKTFGGKNETVSLVLYMRAGESAATDVSVHLSSFTGPSGAGIVSDEVTLANVYNWQNRPAEMFYVRYLPVQGMSQLMMDPSEYEARHYPPRFRRPCTGTAPCSPSGTWTDRQDHNKFYPEILVPYEAVRASSFTVAASSSQAIWMDVYIGKDKTPGVYTSEITVREGVTVSTRIPVELTVYNFTLPDKANFRAVGMMAGEQVNLRHQNEEYSESAAQVATRNRYRQYFKRHKIDSMIGDDAASGVDAPNAEHRGRLNGSLFSAASGYYNAPGQDTPDSLYSIGTYGSWQGATGWSTTNATSFCDKIDTWASWFATNSPDTLVWLYLEDEPANLTNSNKWSTWVSTSCAHSGSFRVKSMVTDSHYKANSDAPYLEIPVSTSYMGTSSQTVHVTVSSYTTNQDGAWYYNAYTPWTGIFMGEADGYEPRQIAWGAYKKNVMNWFIWETTHWFAMSHTWCQGGYGNNYNIWDTMQTFGCRDNLTNNSVKGLTDYQYANLDGVLAFPGTDAIDTGESYGIDGPIGSWRLKMFRRGIQDADYLSMAQDISPSTVTSALSEIVGGKVMWEYNCADLGDCTYGYGERGFSQDASDYEAQRLVLAEALDGETPAPTPSGSSVIFGGGVDLRGGVVIR